jgi:hypothetical protein
MLDQKKVFHGGRRTVGDSMGSGKTILEGMLARRWDGGAA